MFPWGWLNVGIPSVLFDASSKLKLWLNQCNISNAERKDWHKLWYRLSSFPEDELQTTRGESIISPLVPPSAQNFTLFNPLFYEKMSAETKEQFFTFISYIVCANWQELHVNTQSYDGEHAKHNMHKGQHVRFISVSMSSGSH